MTESWLLQELAEKIESADEAKKQAASRTVSHQPPYVRVLIGALDEALRVIGRSGSEVVETVLIGRYGLRKEDIAYNPGAYMSAMKDILDAGSEVLERLMLEEIRKETGITAMSMEDAVFKVKGYYGEEPEAGRDFGLRVEYIRRERSG